MLKKIIFLFVLAAAFVCLSPVNANSDSPQLKVINESMFCEDEELDIEEEEHKKQRMTNIREIMPRFTRIPSF